MKFATQATQHYPPYLKHVATLPWEIKNSNFLQIFSRYGENAKKSNFQCTDFNSSAQVTVNGKCHNSVADGPILTKFGSQMQSDMFAEAA